MYGQQISRMVFLIHPFAWALGIGRPGWRTMYGNYLDYEAAISERWREGIADLGADPEAALAVISPMPQPELAKLADNHLGDRAIVILETVKPGPPNETTHPWSCMRVAQEIIDTFAKRGLTFDPAILDAEGWGESFEGCASNYSRFLTRELALKHPIQVRFDMAVPDYRLLHHVEYLDEAKLSDNVRLHHWITETGRNVAWFSLVRAPSSDCKMCVRLQIEDLDVEVRTYASLIWPIADSICEFDNGALTIPIWGAPRGIPVWGSHVLLADGMNPGRFRETMGQAEVKLCE